MTTVSEFLMDELKRVGCSQVFMVPGGGAMYLNDALRRSGISFVCNLHEQASAIAAEAYSKITGQIGVCLVTTGPGSTNVLTGLVGAWQDSTPVLFISGQVKRSDSARQRGVRSFGVQEVDMLSIVRSCTKHSVSLSDSSTAIEEIRLAMSCLTSGRPGPVWIEIPLDVQSMQIDNSLTSPTLEEPECEIDERLVSEVAAMLSVSKRPVFLIGNGVRLSGATSECRQLIERVGAPVLTTWASIDLISDDHELSVGRPGAVAPRYSNFVVQNADLLIAIGARLDLVVTAFSHKHFARNARLVVVDIDQNEIDKIERRVDVKVRCDAKKFIVGLTRILASAELPDMSAWWERCRSWKTRYPVVSDSKLSTNTPISVYAIAKLLSDYSSKDSTYVCSSSGSGIEIFLHALQVKTGQRVIHTTALGSMGFCLPSIVGVATAKPTSPIIAIDGDGGFFFNVQELATIVSLNPNVSILVLNNNGFSSIRNSQKYWFGEATIAADSTSGLHLPSVSRVVESFGIPSLEIRTLKQLLKAMSAITQPRGPRVFEIFVDPDEQREPRVSSAKNPRGEFISRPLEDMYPFLERLQLRQEMLGDLLPESE